MSNRKMHEEMVELRMQRNDLLLALKRLVAHVNDPSNDSAEAVMDMANEAIDRAEES